MPTINLPEVPGDATFEELTGIVGELSKSLAWLMGVTDRIFVQQQGYAGQNMLTDHSFEMVPTTGSADAAQTFAINTAMLGNYLWWNVTGSPRIRSIYNTGVGGVPYSLFDYQGIIVNNTNYVWQQQPVLTNYTTGPYCFSVHATPKGGNTAGAQLTCSLTVRALDAAGLELGTVSRSFTVSESYSSSDNGKWMRGFVTYQSLPAGTVALEVQVKSGSAEWLEVDGAQLVPASTMQVYSPENQLWAHLHSRDGARHDNLTTLGTITVADRTNTHWAYLTPGVGSTNKLVIASTVGIEHNTAYDGTGTIMYACNDEGKNYLRWIQLQDNNVTTSPAVGALRSNTSVPQFYDGAAWQRLPFQAAAQANNTTANAATQGATYDQAAVQSIADLTNSLKSDFNALLAKLRTAGVIAT